MKPSFRLRHAILGAMLLGSAIALSATPEAPRVAVHYQDLDMSRPQDAKVLYRRISQAARRVCNAPGRHDIAQLALYSKCYDTAIANAVESVNEQALTALHQSRTQKARAS